MYVPPSFQETDQQRLHEFIEGHSFATLVSQDLGEPLASHLPLLLDRLRGPHGTLTGHMARANSQWQSAAGERVLAIFHGPHAYISPTWYEAVNVVPTWNYVAVHASGRLQVIEDRQRLLAIVERTVQQYESSMPQPWSLDSQDERFVNGLLAAIVGFEFEIDRIEGKWKLNQNHPAERRAKVVQHLRLSENPDSREIAALMDVAENE